MSSSQTRQPARSSRDEHKSKTTEALRAAALELFATRGFDHTTTEEIAEKAGVAARTFFRYFPTKESVLYLREQEWFETFASDFLAQPKALSDVVAMRDAFVLAAAGMARIRRPILLYEKAIASSATLRGRRADHQEHDVERVARAIAKRRGLKHPDESCKLLAAVGLVTLRHALDRWLASPASTDLAETIVEEFDLLQQVFTD